MLPEGQLLRFSIRVLAALSRTSSTIKQYMSITNCNPEVLSKPGLHFCTVRLWRRLQSVPAKTAPVHGMVLCQGNGRRGQQVCTDVWGGRAVAGAHAPVAPRNAPIGELLM